MIQEKPPKQETEKTEEKNENTCRSSQRKHVFKKFNSFSKSMSNEVSKTIPDRQLPPSQDAIKIFKAEVSSNRTLEEAPRGVKNLLQTINISKAVPSQKTTTTPVKPYSGKFDQFKHASAKKISNQMNSNNRQNIYTPKQGWKKLGNRRNYKSLSKISNFSRNSKSSSYAQMKTVLNSRKLDQRKFKKLNFSVNNNKENIHSTANNNLNYSLGKYFKNKRNQSSKNFYNKNKGNYKVSMIRKKYNMNEYIRQKDAQKKPKKSMFLTTKSRSLKFKPMDQKQISSSKKSEDRRVSREITQPHLISVYSRTSHPTNPSQSNQIRKTNHSASQNKNSIFCSTNFETRKDSPQMISKFGSQHKLNKLKKMVSNNLKSIEQFYRRRELPSHESKGYLKTKGGFLRKKQRTKTSLTDPSNKENVRTNSNYKDHRTSQKRRKGVQSGTKANPKKMISKILHRFRNNSLKNSKQYTYKTKVFSRDKYINQRLTQMIKLNKR